MLLEKSQMISKESDPLSAVAIHLLSADAAIAEISFA